MNRKEKTTAETTPSRAESVMATQTTDMTTDKPAGDLADVEIKTNDAAVTEPHEDRLADVSSDLAAVENQAANQKSDDDSAATPHQFAAAKVQSAPLPADELLATAVTNQHLALRSERRTTVLYYRAGRALLDVRDLFKKQGRRDFCGHTEAAGIEATFRKRSMQIAAHYESEADCDNLTLTQALEAVHRARFQWTQQQTIVSRQASRPHGLLNQLLRSVAQAEKTQPAPTQPGTSPGIDTAGAASARATSSDAPNVAPAPRTQLPAGKRWSRSAQASYADLTPCEIDAGLRLLEVTNGDRQRSMHVLEVLAATAGEVSQ